MPSKIGFILLFNTQYDQALATLDETPNAPSSELGIFSNMNWSFRHQMDMNFAPNISNSVVNINYNISK